MDEYRIVRDIYLGYEVQRRRWWFPFWIQCNFTNSHISIEQAEEWAKKYAKHEVKRLGNLKYK